MPLYIVAQFHAKPDCEAPLMDALRTVMEATRFEPGCIEIHLYRALADPATFFIQSVWVDEAEFEKHATLPHVTRFLSQVPQWIDHELRVVRCARLA
jgi:quinol monooxygenase YgiN